MAVPNVLQKIRDRCRRVLIIERERNVAVVGMQDHLAHRVPHHFPASTTVAEVMTMGCDGTSLGSTGVPGGTGLAPPLGAFAILLTTSIPATTLPNTV